MKRIKLGYSDLEVTELCFGTMYFGTRVDEKTSKKLLDQYCQAGGNFLDTSNNYAFWVQGASGDESEKLVGKWMKEKGNRSEIVLATKVGARPTSKGAGFDQSEGLSFSTIVNAVEDSLRRLQTDYIDLYYAHVDWYDYPLEERLKAMDQLIRHGKVREIGTSNMNAWRFEESRHMASRLQLKHYCCVQQKHSYLYPRPGADFGVQRLFTQEWMDYGRQHPDLTLIAYSPLLLGTYARGILSEEYDTTDNQRRLEKLKAIANELDATANQVVLAWMRQSSPAIIPLIAASKVEQLAENLGANRVSLSAEQMAVLNELG